MNTQKVFASLLAVSLVLGAINFFKHPHASDVPPFFSGTPTLDGVDNPYVKINGLPTGWYRVPFEATSTRVCKIKNPFNATTTVLAFNAKVSTPLSPAASNNFTLSTTSNSGGFGTSTPFLIYDHNVPSGAQDSVFWSPSSATSTLVQNILPGINPADGAQRVFLAPGQYLVWAISTTSTAATMSSYYGGTCEALFLSA